MADDLKRTGILGDINPSPAAHDHIGRDAATEDDVVDEGAERSMAGGSQQDRSKHSGSREITEGTTGGAEVGGTRNYRTGSGATGSDIGNRPE